MAANASVSLTLIVRDEARTLGRCLNSVKGAVDEIVIVDTGSRDKTKAVARRYTDRVLDFPWRDDFGAARQFAFDHAAGDWVAWLDADDVVFGAEHIRRLAQDAADPVGVFYWRYVTGRDGRGNATCEFWRERLVRRDGAFRWHGRVHEVLQSSRRWDAVQSHEVVVEHRSKAVRDAARGRRNLDILEAEVAAGGGRPAPRLLFYLGREHADRGDAAQALRFLRAYVDSATWDDEHYLAQTMMAGLYRQQGCWEEALDADLQALKIHPRWPDAYFGLGKTYYFLRDWPKVAHWMDIGRGLPPPNTLHFVRPLDYRYGWIIYYTNALYHLGAFQEAEEWTRHALGICPDDAQHLANLRLLTERAGSPDAASKEGTAHG